MDMRSKAYPALPEGRGLHLVLPRAGDLRFRPQIPAAFVQRLHIHADPRRRLWYARFQLQRKFIVMSTQGDLYAKTTVATFTMAELPKKNVLSMPRVSRGDLVKVLDLVQCSRSEGQRWELVFTRWRNGMETWLPLEVVQLYASNLLQEFYVNSINSWAFHSRVQWGNLSIFRTEVELWLFHPEFQDFYKRLRLKRSGDTRPQQQDGQGADQVHVKPERSTASVNTSHTPPASHQTQVPQPPVPVAPASDPSEAVIREFEQRRITRERQEQREQNRQNQLVQLQQQQAEEQRRLDREREIQRIQGQEQARRVQHEQQRQRAHEELQRSQKEYQQRLRAQQEREKVAERQQQDWERRQRATEQERLRQRLQQSKPRSGRSAQKQMHTNQHLQETTPRKQLRYKEHQKKPSPQPASEQSKNRNSSSIWSKGCDDEYVPEASESEDSESNGSSAGSESSDYSLSSRSTRKRRQKRLLYSQVEHDNDDDDDDLPDLSLPRRRTRRHNAPQDSSEDDDPVIKPTRKNKRKRLRQSNQENEEESSDVEVALTQLSDEDDENDDDSVELVTEHAVTAPEIPLEEGDNVSSGEVATDLIVDDDDGDIDDLDFEPSIIVGEIRCGCGATSVGGYRGQWLQCWKEDCGVWEHADCVGFLTGFELNPPPKYLCTKCDPEAYLTRCVKASHRVLDWLFQCCGSRNSKQLMDLLEDNTGAANLPPGWKNAAFENRTLAMHAARNGLVKCLSYLLDERKVDLYATDLQSRNVLHHAALGGSIVCCRFLLKRDRKLLLLQDQRGCMAFHLMLQSAKVNRLCVPFMKEDSALVGMGDLDSNFPVHYACQAVNSYTVKICQMIFAAQPSMLQEKSSQGLYPLMILCKAARTTTAMRNKANTSEVFKSPKDIIALMLNIDVFGDCLNQTGSDGWLPLHFAAASGNHELVSHLCNIGLFDVEYAAKESEQTALHVAAQENHPLCVRALLLEGLNVVAKDADGLIPMLYTEDSACVQEFMHYKLTKQLSRLQRMLGKYQHRGLVRRWQRCVARDSTCFDILNDWCQSDIERIERMEGILLSNPFLLRLDNKLDYVREYIIPSIKSTPGRCSLGVETGEPATENPEKWLGKKKLAFVFSRGSASFWKQFVAMGTRLEPEDFRLPIVFSIERGGGSSQGAENREGNLKLVLIWLAAGLLKAVPGLLVRGSRGDLEMKLSSDKEELEKELLGFFMLGELVAHFVLFAVPLSGILDFTLPFLRCVGCKGKYQLANDKHWKIPGQSFAAGFEAVFPATLELFHANELRVLFNGSGTSLNSLQINWNTAVGWDMRGSEAVRNEDTANAKMWLPRLMSELVEEEQQLLLLFMTDTFPLVNERFFRSESGSGRITVSSYPESDGVLDNDVMYPTMEHKPDVLRLPSYSCYDVFKKRVLNAIRHTNQAFPPE
ncbi:hypothetical protein V7S43_008113 [Phytophthora oleae]|uniref:HECT domain-containing protein n=1 Tax=Phytophthora oleae TaxID=2107226 RepID=A0ABD3FMS7_9STRA